MTDYDYYTNFKSFSDDCRNLMLRECDKLADAVQVTLGKFNII